MHTARREFMRTVYRTTGLGAVAGLAQASALAAQAPAIKQTFHIGYQIFGWGRHFPSAWWKGAEYVGSIGYRGIEGEYTITELYEGREAEFEVRMKRSGVKLSALYSTTDLERQHEQYENTRKNMKAAAFLKRMGGGMIVIGGTHYITKDAELYKICAGAANELGRKTQETYGVKLSIHPHVGSLIETREEIGGLMELTDPRYVFLAPDTGHLLSGGSDPVEVFETYKTRIGHAHLKDYIPPATAGARGEFCLIGRGRIDFPALLRIMGEAGFDGWMNLEVDNQRGMTPSEVAAAGREFIVKTLGLSLDGPTAAPTATSSGGPVH